VIEFTWDIHYKCNYSCPYCWFHGKWEEISVNNIYPGTNNILEVWKRIHEKYGSVHLEITGGEPFIYPDFIKIIIELSRIHSVGVTTNLSIEYKEIEKLVNTAGEIRNIVMSFHPLFADFDKFLNKAKLIKERGFGTTILYLAWPPYISKLQKYKELFESFGFNFSVLTFWGEYGGRKCPQEYTDEEREIINKSIGVRGESGEKFQVTPVKTRGKLCRAGQIYALIHPNGDVYRCGGSNWKVQHPPFGNIFDKNFNLIEEPQPCESDECPCNEWSFLLVDNERTISTK